MQKNLKSIKFQYKLKLSSLLTTHHGKRKDERHDNKYGSKQVAAVQGSPGATGGS
jgi:hypothetical protein